MTHPTEGQLMKDLIERLKDVETRLVVAEASMQKLVNMLQAEPALHIAYVREISETQLKALASQKESA